VLIRRLLTPFSSRNYRLYFAGQSISMMGSWMTQTATVWLVYHLTGSPFWLGLIAFLGQAPAIVLGPVAGVWVDRVDRLKLLLVTQVLAMAQSLALAYFTLSGHIGVGTLTALAICQGMVNAFDMPTRQSLAVQLVEKKEDLAGVIGMNASMFHLARLIGPAVAGFVIAAYGTGYCFLIDGLSYIAVLTAISAMRLAPTTPATSQASVWEEMRLGFRYAYGFLPIRALLFLAAGMGTFGLSFAVLIPVYAKEIFHGDARMLGWFMSCPAAGSVIAALYLAGRKGIPGITRAIVFGSGLAGCGLAAFAFSQSLWLSSLCLVLIGLGAVLALASCNTLVQSLVEEDKRGRVMSIYTVAFLGGMPLGGLLTGSIANVFGVTAATCINALSCLLLGSAFLRFIPRFRAEARPALQRAGMLAKKPTG